MKKTFSLVSLVICMLSMLVFTACKDNPYLSTSIIHSSSILDANETDTFTVRTTTLRSDSVLASGLSSYSFGQMSSTDFGTTKATVYAQFDLIADQMSSFGTIDSMFFVAQYANLIGDTGTQMNITLRAINPTGKHIEAGKSYFSKERFDLETNTLANQTVVCRPKDSVRVNANKLAPHVRVQITDQNFIALIQSQTASTGFYNNTAFHKVCNGIYIDVNSVTANAIIKMNNSSGAYTGLLVYHHNSTTGKDTSSLLKMGSGSVANFQHDFSSAIVTQHINQLNDSVAYLAGFGGLITKIDFPYLSKLNHVIINRARLVIEDLNPNNTKFPAPVNLYLYRKDTAAEALEDVLLGSPFGDLSNSAYYGGNRASNGTYTFNIARYLQRVVDGAYKNSFNGLYLNVLGQSVYGNQIIIGGGNHATHRLKLKMITTTLK
jgi:hypothetical protein